MIDTSIEWDTWADDFLNKLAQKLQIKKWLNYRKYEFQEKIVKTLRNEAETKSYVFGFESLRRGI